jgi:hypothetical protein
MIPSLVKHDARALICVNVSGQCLAYQFSWVGFMHSFNARTLPSGGSGIVAHQFIKLCRMGTESRVKVRPKHVPAVMLETVGSCAPAVL